MIFDVLFYQCQQELMRHTARTLTTKYFTGGTNMAQGIETLFGRTEKNIDSLLRVAGYNNREVVYDRTTETYTSRGQYGITKEISPL